MKIAIVDTYYAEFLSAVYAARSDMATQSYSSQRQVLLDQCFGTSDFYSRHLNALGCDAQDLILNCTALQEVWAKENAVAYSRLALHIPHRLFRLPLIGSRLAALPGLVEIAVAQLQAFKPDVLYCQDMSFFPPEVLATLKRNIKLIVGQIACPLPPDKFSKAYDLILTSFPHYVRKLIDKGVASEYFRIGFEPRILDLLGTVNKSVDVSFVGGLSRHHGKTLPIFEYLVRNTPIQFFGYGLQSLDKNSPIRMRHNGEVWGLDMYRALASSRITLNRHINVAENNANNMRLYEATGVGAMLLTDKKDNLNELFEIGKEVVEYSTEAEAAELIDYYLSHPEEAKVIAQAGQNRTLQEHTYLRRMEELVAILKRHLSKRFL